MNASDAQTLADSSLLAFREEVREFLVHAVSDAMRARVRAGLRPRHLEWKLWHQRLHAHGWGAPSWPVEHGGTGWSDLQFYVFEEECARADAPPLFHQGLELIGPIIFTYGSDEQKQRYLPRILSGEDWWCQGYSEPGAGSDLASLRAQAVRDDDHYVVNGQKIWTSFAHEADMIFCLVRTSKEDKKQKGISLLLADIRLPGITIRPIPLIDEEHQLNEVFLDDVRIPFSGLVGEEGKGWGYGKVLLKRERHTISTSSIRLARQLEYIREEASENVARHPYARDAGFWSQLAQLEIDVITLRQMGLRALHAGVDDPAAGWRGSMLKIRWSEILQRITELRNQLLGREIFRFAECRFPAAEGPRDAALPFVNYLFSRASSIYAGSTEVQKNIIARQGLGL